MSSFYFLLQKRSSCFESDPPFSNRIAYKLTLWGPRGPWAFMIDSHLSKNTAQQSFHRISTVTVASVAMCNCIWCMNYYIIWAHWRYMPSEGWDAVFAIQSKWVKILIFWSFLYQVYKHEFQQASAVQYLA